MSGTSLAHLIRKYWLPRFLFRLFPESLVDASPDSRHLNYRKQEPVVQASVATNHDAMASIPNCSYNSRNFAVDLENNSISPVTIRR